MLTEFHCRCIEDRQQLRSFGRNSKHLPAIHRRSFLESLEIIIKRDHLFLRIKKKKRNLTHQNNQDNPVQPNIDYSVALDTNHTQQLPMLKKCNKNRNQVDLLFQALCKCN
jgi:hypothetical protein